MAETGEAGAETDAFRVCIHRGTRQIGGTCVELAHGPARLLLDLGLPLDAGQQDPSSLLPQVAGLHMPDPNLLALVLSHGHADHWGLAPYAAAPLPVITGAATRRIMRAASAFVPGPTISTAHDEATRHLSDRQTVQIGPFTITPFLMDHSAFDAYAMLIEAGGRRLFYSGDLRGHGRKSALFDRLLQHPPRPVHAMLMEGSSLGRLPPDATFPSEQDIEAQLVTAFRARGFVGVCASAQNIDRMVSIYRACKRTARTLVLDLYAAEILAATGNPRIPKAGWPNTAIYVPEYQRRHIARTRRFDLVHRYRPARLYRKALAALAPRAVMLLRPAMMTDLNLTPGIWNGARVIWSQWEGYLSAPANAAFRAELSRHDVPLHIIHTSGHASIKDLRRLALALAPEALIPIHTFEGDRYPELFGNNVRRHNDGDWWEV